LSELESTGGAEYPRISLRRFLIVTILLVLADQISKTLVTIHLLPGASIPVLGDFFRITFVQNPGGVFGTRLGNQNFYTLISILAIGVTLWFFFKIKAKENVLRFGLCLVLGGAVGNLIDRFRFGQVVDFLDFDFFNINLPPQDVLFFRFPGFSLDRWPVFNLADGYILIGMVLVIIYLLFIQERPIKEDMSSPPKEIDKSI
jgi:signal peptidase II